MTALIIVETAVLVVLSVLVAGLLRSYATVLQRLHQLDGGDGSARTTAPPVFRTTEGVVPPADRGPVDLPPVAGRDEWSAAHDIVGVGLTGEVISARTVAVAHDTVLVFLSSGCSGCTGFWEQLGNSQRPPDFGSARIVVVTKGPEDENVPLLTELSSRSTDLVMSTIAWTDYSVPGSPYVVVVDGQTGRVKGEGSGTSLTQVSGLVRQAASHRGLHSDQRAITKPRSDAEREVDVDRVLLAAGIGPGHPSLYVPEDGWTNPALNEAADVDAHWSPMATPPQVSPK